MTVSASSAGTGNAVYDLTGKVVVLTGAAGHLGSEATLLCLKHGAQVIAVGRSEARLTQLADAARARGVGSGLVLCAADVSEDAGLDRIGKALERTGGRCHGWVNNAFGGPGGRLMDVDRAAVNETLARGVGDVVMAIQRAARWMPHGGAIVNVSSIYGAVSPDPSLYAKYPQFHNPPAYGAAKAGVLQITRYAACELAPQGIRVNSLSPGAFPKASVQQAEGFVEALAGRNPLGRIGQPQELAPAMVFLLSHASCYMTGQNLLVDGGFTAW